MRGAVLATGALLLGYGTWLLLTTQDAAGVRATVVWAAVAIVAHDAVLAPVVVVVGWLGARRLRRDATPGRRRLAAVLVVVAVVLGTVTLVAVPVLGRFGAVPDNPTVLGRDYVSGWLAVAGVTVAFAVALVAARLITGREGTKGPPDR